MEFAELLASNLAGSLFCVSNKSSGHHGREQQVEEEGKPEGDVSWLQEMHQMREALKDAESNGRC